jgi:hypothetical protein
MDAAKGNSLYELEHVRGFDMTETVKKLASFVDQWALYNAELATLQFEQIGSLQRDGDNVHVNKLCSQANVYYTDLVETDEYRGPFHSSSDYLLATSELKCKGLSSASNVLKKSSYHDFLQSKLIESMFPYYLDSTLSNGPFVLSHVDFDIQNILVDEKNGFKITGVVDWDFAAVVPLQSHIRVPDMLMCDTWTESRQHRKVILPWQIDFAKMYREHYKLCLKRHLQDRKLEYPTDSLLENSYLYSRYERAIAENPDDEGFDVLWSHVYGKQLDWNDVIKRMGAADWGTVMAERLSLAAATETDGTNETELDDTNPRSRPETHDTFKKFGNQNPKWTKRFANKLRWGWWHIEQCILCRTDSKRVPVLMRAHRGISQPTSSAGVMRRDLPRALKANAVEAIQENLENQKERAKK